MNHKLYPLAALSLCACAAIPIAASSQTFLVKPVRVISTFAPGSVADLSIRQLAQKMTESIGQPVVVDVRMGGGGVVGAEATAHSAPDGYTVVVAQPTTILVVPLLLKKKPYDPIKSFTPITHAIDGPTCIVVNAAVPVNSVKELIAYIRRNPGKLAYGHNGIGGTYHLQMEYLRQQLGLDMTPVPYKGGIAALMDAVTGVVPIAFSAAGSALPQVRAGKVKMLAILDTQRYADLPDVPAMSEDLPDFEKLPTGLSIYGPAAMPNAVVQRLYAEIAKGLKAPDVQAKLKEFAFYAVGSAPAQFAARQERDLENFAKAVKAAGLKPE